MKQRTDWVDYGKGIGIILVVYGHLLSSGYHAQLSIKEHFFSLSDSIVYSFHMPFFFFLTGLFVDQSLKKRGLRHFLANKFQHIAYPYVIWSLLQSMIELFFSHHNHRGITIEDLLAIPYKPWSQFWFLYALLLMYVISGIFSMFGRYATAITGICAATLFFFPIKTDIAALQGFSTEFLFFVSGMFVKKYRRDSQQLTVPPAVAWSSFLFLVGVGSLLFSTQISPTRLTNGSHPFYFLFLSTLGILACTGLSQLLARHNCCRFIKILGVHSLPIYLVHMLAGVGTRIVLLKVFHLENPVAHITVGTLIGLLTPLFLYRFSLKIHFPYLFCPSQSANMPEIHQADEQHNRQ